jgi:muramoyltetrapeptide carboxypeptidase
MHLLPFIDWQWVKDNPKVFIGFSDITVLLLTMLKETGLVGFHGPMLTSNLIENNDQTQAALWQMVMGETNYPNIILKPEADEYKCLQSGVAEGLLMGGNLSLLCALCGTPYQPNFEGAVLFIEDWHESYYSIDRQWQQLKMAGIFNGIKGLILGDFVEITDSDTWPNFGLANYFKALTQDLQVPVGLGLKFGHAQQTATLPVGAACRFEATTGHLEILHAPVC